MAAFARYLLAFAAAVVAVTALPVKKGTSIRDADEVVSLARRGDPNEEKTTSTRDADEIVELTRRGEGTPERYSVELHVDYEGYHYGAFKSTEKCKVQCIELGEKCVGFMADNQWGKAASYDVCWVKAASDDVKDAIGTTTSFIVRGNEISWIDFKDKDYVLSKGNQVNSEKTFDLDSCKNECVKASEYCVAVVYVNGKCYTRDLGKRKTKNQEKRFMWWRAKFRPPTNDDDRIQ
jgi:hypothetical protein